MRQDAVTLQRFYASPLGQAATRILSGKLTDLWGDARGLSLLG
ncbi:MAG TPA: methyltransferase type 11, partial [Hyphomonas sp.]|nr:methyltransferase type 11 [Hyphomonas sp.]HBX96751.1 methyltransferase type 11 [Hyphomonas sp.]